LRIGAAAAAEEIGAPFGAFLVVMPSANTCPLHADNIFAFTPCRTATSDTFAPATKLSATINALRLAGHRRLRAPERSPPSPPSPNQPLPYTMPPIAAPSVNQQPTTSFQHARTIYEWCRRNGYNRSNR